MAREAKLHRLKLRVWDFHDKVKGNCAGKGSETISRHQEPLVIYFWLTRKKCRRRDNKRNIFKNRGVSVERLYYHKNKYEKAGANITRSSSHIDIGGRVQYSSQLTFRGRSRKPQRRRRPQTTTSMESFQQDDKS